MINKVYKWHLISFTPEGTQKIMWEDDAINDLRVMKVNKLDRMCTKQENTEAKYS